MATATAVSTGVSNATVFGNKRVTVTNVALDSSYPSGGESISASDLGLRKVDFAISTLKTTATTTVNIANAHYDTANSKLVVFDETPAEVTGDLAGAVVQIVAFGS
jgi:ABC-type sugar transport system ATPase subunit